MSYPGSENRFGGPPPPPPAPESSAQPLTAEQWQAHFAQERPHVGSRLKKALGLGRRHGGSEHGVPHRATPEGRLGRARDELDRVAGRYAPQTHERVHNAGQRAREAAHDFRHDPLGATLGVVEASQRMAADVDARNADRTRLQKAMGSVGGKVAMAAIDQVWSLGTGWSGVDVANLISGARGKDLSGQYLDTLDRTVHVLASLTPGVSSTAIIEGVRAVRKRVHNTHDKHGAQARALHERWQGQRNPYGQEPYAPVPTYQQGEHQPYYPPVSYTPSGELPRPLQGPPRPPVIRPHGEPPPGQRW